MVSLSVAAGLLVTVALLFVWRRRRLERAEFSAALRDPETATLVAATAEEAYRRGAFGVPTFFLGAEMFWGNDRIVTLKHVLSRCTGRT